ncbi:MAG: hypothetical protein Fur0019_17340 [Tibeticola sp.]
MDDAAVKTARPSGYVRNPDGSEAPVRAALVRKIMEGWALKREMEELDARLKAVNAELMEALGEGASAIVPGVCRVNVARRESVRITDAERLAAVLGDGAFHSLVKAEVAYKPEPRLVEMSADGDEPLAPAIRACLSVGSSTVVTWRAEK